MTCCRWLRVLALALEMEREVGLELVLTELELELEQQKEQQREQQQELVMQDWNPRLRHHPLQSLQSVKLRLWHCGLPPSHPLQTPQTCWAMQTNAFGCWRCGGSSAACHISFAAHETRARSALGMPVCSTSKYHSECQRVTKQSAASAAVCTYTQWLVAGCSIILWVALLHAAVGGMHKHIIHVAPIKLLHGKQNSDGLTNNK